MKIGFIGFGLIGGSVAKSLDKRVKGKYEIVVYDHHKTPSENFLLAKSEGVVAEITSDLASMLDVDILFLCAPTLRNIAYLEQLIKLAADNNKELPLISDVGSVKGNIAIEAKRLNIASHFIGSHPMAGSEKTGYPAATDHLLENAYWIITPNDESSEEDFNKLETLIKETGAISIKLDPKEHDRITAAISHVPHVIAASLVNLIQDSDDSSKMQLLAAGGFKDITRIASSSPEMWESILLSNREATLATMDHYQAILDDFRKAVEEADGPYINNEFLRAGVFRNSIPDSKGMLPRSFCFYIDIEDKVGAIATVATQLFIHDISIKNIGIIHNREHEQGVLKVDFYTEREKIAASNLLSNSGYTIYNN